MLKIVREGDFSNGIYCSDGWIWIFRVDRREDADAPPPFEACRERVRILAWADRRRAIHARIDDDLFRAALEAGQHRDSYHRAFIVQSYVDRRKMARGALLAEMRERFRVDVLPGD